MPPHSDKTIQRQRFAKWLTLALVLVVGVVGVYALAAFTHEVIRIHGSDHWLVIGGATVSGASIWVLAKTAIDLTEHATKVVLAIRAPGWSEFGSAVRTLASEHFLAILGIVFSAAFVGQDVKEEFLLRVDPDRQTVDPAAIKKALDTIDVQAAMTQQGYTAALANALATEQPDVRAGLTAHGYTSELAQALGRLADASPPDLHSVLANQGYTRELANSLALLTAADHETIHNVIKIAQEDLQTALTTHGYTTERAELLDILAKDTARRSSETRFATFPFAFERGTAELGERAEDEPDSESATRLAYDPEAHDRMIRRIVSALVPCTSDDSPVELLVEGYASSEPFGVSPESDRLNLQLAHNRRDAITAALNRAIERADATGRFKVYAAADYKDLDQMRRYRGFNDRPSEAGGELADHFAQDFLTRAAHVQVVGLGLCAVR